MTIINLLLYNNLALRLNHNAPAMHPTTTSPATIQTNTATPGLASLAHQWMLRPSHKLCLNLHAIQHSSLEIGGGNVHARKGAVCRSKLILAQDAPHAHHFVGTQWDSVWNAPEKGKAVQTRRLFTLLAQRVDIPFSNARRRRHERVCNKQTAFKQGHHGSVKVTAKLNQLNTSVENISVNVRHRHLVRGALRRPLHVLRRQVYWTLKGARPIGVCRVVMRMADGDGPKTAHFPNSVDSIGIKKRKAVPEHVAGRSLDKDGTLVDGESRSGLDVNDSRVISIGDKDVLVDGNQVVHGSKRLTRGGNILTRVITDVASLDGFAVGSGKLSSAGVANEVVI